MLNPRPTSPVDQDLQNLYNEVWAGFTEETLSNEKDIDNIYSVYGADSDYAAPANGTHPYVQGRHQSPAPSKPPQNAAPSKAGAVRRLPPTPGGSSSTTSPNSSFAMPEPDPYYDGTRPSHYTNDSYTSTASTDLLKMATAGNASGRRLPSAPGSGTSSRPGSSGDRPPMHGLPSDPRSSTQYTSSTPNGAYQTASYMDMSTRPAGALPPSVPGYRQPIEDGSIPSPSFEIFDPNGNTDHRDPQALADSVQYHYPTSDQSQTLGGSNSVSRRPSPDQSTYSMPTADYTANGLSPYEGYGHSPTVRGSSSSQSGYYSQQITPVAHNTNHLDPSMADPSDYHSNITRGDSTGSYVSQAPFEQTYVYDDMTPGDVLRRPSDMLRTLADYGPKGHLELQPEDEGEYWEDDDEYDESRFVNFSFLSHMAVQLRDKVPRGTHVKGSIPYPRAFTGKDIVSTIQTQIQRELAINHGLSTNDRRAALQVARSLQSQLFFYEVEWGGRVLQDGVEDVYMFLDDQEGGSSEVAREREELPTGVVTMLTRCYTPSCGDGAPCYAYACPRRGNSIVSPMPSTTDTTTEAKKEEWTEIVDQTVLQSLPESEINRQTIIHKIISKEEQYVEDLDTIESVFIKPLRVADPPIMLPDRLEEFIDEVFGNILDLRECNKRLLEVMYVRQREQAPVIQRIGDIFLGAAAEFRLAYPTYIGHHPVAEKRLKEEIDINPEFRLFLEHCSRQSARPGESLRYDLKHFLNRPSEHLQKYPVLLDAIFHETAEGNPDADFLLEAIEAIKNLQSVSQLRTFQSAMGKGVTGNWAWHDLVSTEVRKALPKEEAKRQSIIFELIKGEMAYVKDLENIDFMYIQPLRAADPPIIHPKKLDQFIQDVFHNFAELHVHHRKLVEKFHEIQREEHPTIHSVTAAVFDAALNFRESYMEYIPNYPIAAYRIDDEMANNPAFKAFVEQCVRHPDAHRLDMKNFINRPIPRLLRYELLLRGILEETPPGHEDIDAIPHVIDVIKALGKETEPGVFSAKQKVELWRYNSNLVFKQGEAIDMDLLDENRSLIYSGKLLRQPDSGLEWNGWSELFVLLFDNYMVMTKPKERDGITKYFVNRRPIPLDLLTPVNFTDPPTQRSTGILRNLRGERHAAEGMSAANVGASPDTPADSRSVYPLTLHHNGRLGGPYILYAESSQTRNEWKQKLEEALGLRKVVQESNKVFEVETLSADTFLTPAMMNTATSPSWNQETTFTGKVTCSVPFNTADGRGLVAIGCAEGVWIGFRHDPKSMRRVLHLKMVTQCAMLEEFGIFLVLADKSLFAYHIEALVPSSPQTAQTSQVPQKLNGTKDVHFFSVGCLHGRTLIIYMKKKGLDSIFRVLEPVGDKINEKVKAPVGFSSRLGFRSTKSEWFRIYRDFFLPSESFDIFFLKARIAILCAKGFEIMDLNEFNSVTIPQKDEPRLAALAKRCESCRPVGMFKSTNDDFLLCYDEFGLYVDKHGDPSRSAGTIEWEGTVERVALHSPYILLFDTRFIEIRHVETGRLMQIIPGNDVRCIWDGRGVGSNVSAPSAIAHDADSPQEAQVHAVMNSTEVISQGGLGGRRALAQHVFELIPTIQLYPPGPLSMPPPTTYFPPSGSPPNSPEMRSSSSWRS